MKAAPWEEEFDERFPTLCRPVEYYEYELCTGEVKEFIEALLAKQAPQSNTLPLMGRDSGPELVVIPVTGVVGIVFDRNVSESLIVTTKEQHGQTNNDHGQRQTNEGTVGAD